MTDEPATKPYAVVKVRHWDGSVDVRMPDGEYVHMSLRELKALERTHYVLRGGRFPNGTG